MTAKLALSDLDLAALMCSRVCHDIISPVGAIANGLEVLDDEDDEEMRAVALDLIKKSATQASAKLQFCRLAFGAAGSASAHIDLADAQQITAGFLGSDKVQLSWSGPQTTRPKNEVKLLLNMILVAVAAIPRGGTITVLIEDGVIAVTASGDAIKVPESYTQILSGDMAGAALEPRSIQVYHALRLASDAGMSLSISVKGDTAEIRAELA